MPEFYGTNTCISIKPYYVCQSPSKFLVQHGYRSLQNRPVQIGNRIEALHPFLGGLRLPLETVPVTLRETRSLGTRLYPSGVTSDALKDF